jgi:hypothetical protein
MIWAGVNVSKFPRVATPPTKTPTKPPIFRGIWNSVSLGRMASLLAMVFHRSISQVWGQDWGLECEELKLCMVESVELIHGCLALAEMNLDFA